VTVVSPPHEEAGRPPCAAGRPARGSKRGSGERPSCLARFSLQRSREDARAEAKPRRLCGSGFQRHAIGRHEQRSASIRKLLGRQIRKIIACLERHGRGPRFQG
jgi:hypothetical protein